jgi:hypothetical protein
MQVHWDSSGFPVSMWGGCWLRVGRHCTLLATARCTRSVFTCTHQLPKHDVCGAWLVRAACGYTARGYAV